MSDPTSIGEALLGRLASPDVYLYDLDLVRESVTLAAFDANTYRSASFLDHRATRQGMASGTVTLPRLVAAARAVASAGSLHFIFHTGHVGSTLVSRLLDEAGGVLALREPLPLRSLAEIHDSIGRPDALIGGDAFVELTETLLQLWGRGYPATRAVILKATSTAGRLAPLLLERQPAARAIYLNLRAEAYLATLLGGANAGLDLRGHWAERVRRLQSFGVQTLPAFHALSRGEVAAMSWLAESWSQSNALNSAGARVVAVDFEALLSNLRGELGRILSHLGLAHSTQFLDGVAQSPALTRYAKAPEHAYSPQLRAQILRQSRVQNGEEIRKGLAWLEKIASANAAAGTVVARAGL